MKTIQEIKHQLFIYSIVYKNQPERREEIANQIRTLLWVIGEDSQEIEVDGKKISIKVDQQY